MFYCCLSNIVCDKIKQQVLSSKIDKTSIIDIKTPEQSLNFLFDILQTKFREYIGATMFVQPTVSGIWQFDSILCQLHISHPSVDLDHTCHKCKQCETRCHIQNLGAWVKVTMSNFRKNNFALFGTVTLKRLFQCYSPRYSKVRMYHVGNEIFYLCFAVVDHGSHLSV